MSSLDPTPVAVHKARTQEEARQRGLVLASVGIPSRLVPHEGRILVMVPASDAQRAVAHLEAYEAENREPPRRRHRTWPMEEGVSAAMAYCAVLLFFHTASRRNLFGLDWWNAGMARAAPILEGELWRAMTALTLHGDLGHLLGNMAFGVLFGLLLAQQLGAGLAWLCTLLAGTGGNLLNAALRDGDHSAVGASTAVFAAIGIVSSVIWRRRAVRWPYGLARFAPIGAGILLLAYLGFGGERTDILAHVLGFVVGVVMGAGLALFGDRLPEDRQSQRGYGVATCAIFALAWIWGLARAV